MSNDEQLKFPIKLYLVNRNPQNNYGTCLQCNKLVYWSRQKILSHKRRNCTAYDVDDIQDNNNTSNDEIVLEEKEPLFLTDKKEKKKRKSHISSISNKDMNIQNELEDLLARYLISCSIPLQIIDSNSFQSFINVLNPTFKIPSSKVIKDKYINEIYNNELNKYIHLLDDFNSYILLCDYYSYNHDNESINQINFIIIIHGNITFLYKSMQLIDNNCYDIINTIVEELYEDKINNIIINNLPIDIIKQIQLKYPKKLITLLSISYINKFIQNLIDLNEDYILATEKTNKVFQFITKYQEIFNELIEFNTLSNKSNWLSKYQSMLLVIKSKSTLKSLIDSELINHSSIRINQRNEYIDIISNTIYWSHLDLLIDYIKEPIRLFDELVNNDADIALIYYHMRILNKIYNDKSKKQLYTNCFNSLLTDSMKFAYILSPIYHSEEPMDNRIEIANSLMNYSSIYYDNNETLKEKFKLELQSFLTQYDRLQPAIIDMHMDISARSYWVIYGKFTYPTIYPIALNIFSIPTSINLLDRTRNVYDLLYCKHIQSNDINKLAFLNVNLSSSESIDFAELFLDGVDK